ncbi:hypothetical protein ACQEU8_24555 [Streptomyces sp. CA-250714]|uniref:hypothetical protein n=1 Tax=Streptomyces sp. CA-250714 TaxID=3240060 RepID=UPI003D8F4E1A
MRRFPTRTATTIAALAVTALVPLCGVAQAAPSDTPGTASSAPADHAPGANGSAPAPGAHSQDGSRPQGGLLPKIGNRDGALGLGFLGLI